MKLFTGRVIATKNLKTATVAVDRFISHPRYKKRLKRTEKYQVHDEIGVTVGDRVTFVASAPMSKTKRWKIVEDLNKKSQPKEQLKAEKPAVKPKKAVKKAKKS